MRLEWAILVGCCLASAWLLYDEEPILDLTDLGLVQSLCLLAAATSVFWENIGRAGVGYFTSRDRQLGFWTLTFLVGLDLYFKLVVLVFFGHSLAPLWVDQVESTTLYAFCLGTYWGLGVQILGMLTLTLGTLYASQRTPYWLPLLLILGGGLGVSAGDLLVSGLTSSSTKSQPTPYGFTPSACTYENRLGGSGFDWHKSTTQPNSFFFVDAASFFYGLLLLITALVAVYVLCMGILGHMLGGSGSVSYGYRAVLIRLVEQVMVGVGGGLLVVVGLGFRVGFEHYAVGL
jgi:hypothetical protein